MNFRYIATVGILFLSACGSGEKKPETVAPAASPPPVVDFKTISGMEDSLDDNNVCPYIEIAGNYKISRSQCSLGGKKADVDYLLIPSRYFISEITSGKGLIEVQFTGDGQELSNDSMEFPRIQTPSVSKRLGVKCANDSITENLQLFQACLGNRITSNCFNAITKKDGKLFAIVSRIKNGVQYWCKSSLVPNPIKPEEIAR